MSKQTNFINFKRWGNLKIRKIVQTLSQISTLQKSAIKIATIGLISNVPQFINYVHSFPLCGLSYILDHTSFETVSVILNVIAVTVTVPIFYSRNCYSIHHSSITVLDALSNQGRQRNLVRWFILPKLFFLLSIYLCLSLLFYPYRGQLRCLICMKVLWYSLP